MWKTLCILLSVASNGVIGSVDENLEVCDSCRKGPCKTISGLYTKPDLPAGYSLVTQIPSGACNVIIQQLMNTNNHIALKNANGSFIINGDWKFGSSRNVESAGTKFYYKGQDATTKESISASGPLTNSIDILLVTQQPNPGIKYDYALPVPILPNEQISPPYQKRPVLNSLEPKRLDTLPNSVTQHDEAKPGHSYRRRVRKRFSWKIAGVSPCSKSCGGGLQTTLYSCVKEHGHSTVSDKRCSHLDRPTTQQIRCNSQPCPAFWGGTWSTCSGSCGQGVQNFIVHCQQESPTGQLLIVNDGICKKVKPATSSRPCRLSPCENESDNEVNLQPNSSNMVQIHEWKVGPWSQCSVSCGTGSRTRSVSCPNGRCAAENRPSHAEYCDSGNCATYGRTSSWLVSEWSHCSESCGTGTQLRLAFCGSSACDLGKPETERQCSSDRYCVGQWFVGPWGPCSDSCGSTSKQTREVFCLVKVRGQTRITNDMTCSVQDKPSSEKLCHGQCSPRWFVGEWSFCEGNCPTGIQRRDVRCMDANGAVSNLCSDSDRPIIKRACGCEKKDDQMNVPAQDEPQDNNCVDNIRNCHLVVQARLCQYQYYTDNCCMSCRKSSQENIQ
ncbi:hypothetical protein FQR65_LT03102 [Abscondita terminalis]|nr:hypothetical protein FQR65_LT03102 [Abscondita terminalis]